MLEAMLLAGRKNDTLLARGYDNQHVSFLNVGAFNRGNDTETWTDQSGTVSDPAPVAIDRRGYVHAAFIAGVGGSGNRLIKYDRLGNEVFNIDSGQQGFGLAVDGDGFIYFSGSNAVKKYSSTGAQQWLTTISGGGGQVAIDINNNAMYSNSNSGATPGVSRINATTGAIAWTFNRFFAAKEIAVDSVGAVYGLTGNQLRKINSSGAIVWTSTNYETANGVTVDEDDNIYATFGSGGNSRLVKFDTAGNELYNVSTSTLSPLSTTVDDKGLIYIGQESSGGLTSTRIHDAETGAFVQQLTYPAISGSPNTSRIAVYQRWRQ